LKVIFINLSGGNESVFAELYFYVIQTGEFTQTKKMVLVE